MKVNTFKTLSLLGLASLSILSCRKDDEKQETSSSIENLKSLSFVVPETKIVSETKTGEVRYNPNNGTFEYEYLKEVQKPYTIDEMSLVGIKNTDIIFPGSILRGSSFLDGNYDPITSQTPFKDVMVSVSLRGRNYNIQESSKPIISKIRATINTLVTKNKYDIDYTAVPAYISYQSNIVNTTSSFNKSLNIHANANVLGGLVSTKFGYTDEFKNSNSSKYVMVRLTQNFYNVSIDPKHYTEWFDGNPNVSDFGAYEPVYVSNVNYGRAAYLLIQTNESEEETKKTVSASVGVALKVVNANVDFNRDRTFRKWFQDSKIRVVIVGGPSQLAGQVDSYEKFVEFIKTPTVEDLISSAAPISYKVRRLKDNTEVEVKTTISEKELGYKKD